MIREKLASDDLCDWNAKFYFEDEYLMDSLCLSDFPNINEKIITKSNPLQIQVL